MARRVRTGSNIARPPAPSPTVPDPDAQRGRLQETDADRALAAKIIAEGEAQHAAQKTEISSEALTALMAEASAAHSMSEKLVTRDLHSRIREITADSPYDTAIILVSIGNRAFSSGNAGVPVLQAHLTLIKDMIVQQGGTVE